MMDVGAWLRRVTVPESIWYLKRLSANDTQQSGSHQAGPYMPKNVMFALFPTLNRQSERNPDHFFDLVVDSSAAPVGTRARVVWYNNALHDNRAGGRNEIRITRLGGASSPLLDVENTGALAVFAFQGTTQQASANSCRVWVCRSADEEDLVEHHWGAVEPGQGRLVGFKSQANIPQADRPCWLDPDDIPKAWLEDYPTGEEIVRKAVELKPASEADVDDRLIERRQCEFEVFQSLEEAVELPRIRNGFADLASFIQRANTILQRRKARAGLSLELHMRTIFEEEALEEGQHFSYQASSEAGKRPDFLFPSEEAYRDTGFPSDRLRMLAVKTTCRDRWRQILNEADRVQIKHLLTLQEGVSPSQYREMKQAGVRLVVPRSLHRAYGKEYRDEILDVSTFIQELQTL